MKWRWNERYLDDLAERRFPMLKRKMSYKVTR